MFTDDQLAIVRFCADECCLQGSGELSVGWMVEAWRYAMLRALVHGADYPNDLDIHELGRLTEPAVNREGYRTVNVRVGLNVKQPHERVPRLMDNLLASGQTLSPSEWFREYEEIHPFRDGNGRTGQILFNWLSGSLDDPKMAPDFWGDPRRPGLAPENTV